MEPLAPSSAACINRIREILGAARAEALRTVNAAMVSAYWHIGREIVEEEQQGEGRAEYGVQLMAELSARLTAEFGRGFSERNLRFMRQFYLAYRDRSPAIRPPVSRELPASGSPAEIRNTPCTESEHAPVEAVSTPGEAIRNTASTEFGADQGTALSPALSWSHYRVLMRVGKPEARSFYEVTNLDVQNAYTHTMKAAERAGCPDETQQRIRDLVARESFGERFVTKVLGRILGLP